MIKGQSLTVIEIFRNDGKKNSFFRNAPVRLFRKWQDYYNVFALVPTFRREDRKEKGDVAEYPGPDKMMWVRAGSGGVSLSDRVPKTAGRELVVIPALTYLPLDLIFSRDRRQPDGSYHFTIHPMRDMQKIRFVRLLIQFELSLRNLVNSSGLTQLT